MTLLIAAILFACNQNQECAGKLIALPTPNGPLMIKASLIQSIESLDTPDGIMHFLSTSKREWKVSCSPEECLKLIGEQQ